MPEVKIPGQMYASGHTNDGVEAMIFLLDDWFAALEAGTAHLRMPDPSYQRPRGQALWTEEDLDTLVRDIDAEIDQEVNRAPGTFAGAKAGPDFKRLATPQRLALAQQLEVLMEEHQHAIAMLVK